MKGRLDDINTNTDPYPLAQILVDPDRLNHNLDQFSGEHQLAPVIKSNAYGHGLELVADALSEREDVPFVCLAAMREVRRLREKSFDLPAVIIGYTPTSQITAAESENTAFAISSLEQLKELDEKLEEKRRFHLNVDTGMHRYGVSTKEVEVAIDIITDNPKIALAGAFSHFSDAFSADSSFTRRQIDRWGQAAEKIAGRIDPLYLHTAATSGHFYRADVTANVERIGIGMYGITDYASDLHLQPALSLRSIIVSTKTVSAGAPIGYSRSYTPKEKIQVGVVPIGYHEGVDRRLSNQGTIRVGNQACPIVGKVSMNATMIDITHVPGVSAGDTVTVISADPDAENSVLNIAREIDTIPYEILTSLSPELTRKAVHFNA